MSDPTADTTTSTVHLLSLSTTLPDFIASLTTLSPPPLIIAKVARWIHPPEVHSVECLVADKSWDILLLLEGDGDLPESLKDKTQNACWITTNVPKNIVEGFRDRNRAMLHPNPEDIPVLPAKIADHKPERHDKCEPLALQVSPELSDWFRSFPKADGDGPVSMLNLLKYAEKEQYIEYVKAFGQVLTTPYGGTLKVVGEVVNTNGEKAPWDDIAIVQYPSITHFADMLASEEYATIDRKYKLGALEDTGLLCVVELDLEHKGMS